MSKGHHPNQLSWPVKITFCVSVSSGLIVNIMEKARGLSLDFVIGMGTHQQSCISSAGAY